MYYGKQTDAGGWYIVSVDEVNPITEKPEVGSKMKYLGTTEKGEVTEDNIRFKDSITVKDSNGKQFKLYRIVEKNCV